MSDQRELLGYISMALSHLMAWKSTKVNCVFFLFSSLFFLIYGIISRENGRHLILQHMIGVLEDFERSVYEKKKGLWCKVVYFWLFYDNLF